jgi:hypothetical protein
MRQWQEVNPTRNPKTLEELFQKMGLEVEVEASEYGSVKELTLKGSGVTLRFGHGFNVYRLKPNVVKKHRLSGLVAGLKVEEQFESHEEADERRTKLSNLQEPGEDALKVEEVEIEVANG